LGNDFVPNGLSFRIRENGHERLMTYLRRLHGAGLRLRAEEGLSFEGWSQIFKWLAADEERFMTKALQQKKSAVMAAKGHYGAEDLPLQMFEESDGLLLSDRGTLKRDWPKLYATHGLGAPAGHEIHYLTDSARQYLNSIEWTYNYYCKGDKHVSFDWMYPYGSAPLFGPVSAIFKGFGSFSTDATKPIVNEQLAIVLPPSSWYLIPKCEQRQLLIKAPWLFPKGELKYNTFGKRFTWECEAEIPIPTISEVRSILK
jgi:5'-3' exonuclease